MLCRKTKWHTDREASINTKHWIAQATFLFNILWDLNVCRDRTSKYVTPVTSLLHYVLELSYASSMENSTKHAKWCCCGYTFCYPGTCSPIPGGCPVTLILRWHFFNYFKNAIKMQVGSLQRQVAFFLVDPGTWVPISSSTFNILPHKRVPFWHQKCLRKGSLKSRPYLWVLSSTGLQF